MIKSWWLYKNRDREQTQTWTCTSLTLAKQCTVASRHEVMQSGGPSPEPAPCCLDFQPPNSNLNQPLYKVGPPRVFHYSNEKQTDRRLHLQNEGGESAGEPWSVKLCVVFQEVRVCSSPPTWEKLPNLGGVLMERWEPFGAGCSRQAGTPTGRLASQPPPPQAAFRDSISQGVPFPGPPASTAGSWLPLQRARLPLPTHFFQVCPISLRLGFQFLGDSPCAPAGRVEGQL